ncbi:MAG: hypothetical protein LBH45_00540 [Campylobacteraceae bacterium]|jgi:hypothetical protein|nr:hypothetical protein [Campylobacteraceae bacterium]
MKKMFFVTIFMIVGFLFVGCGGGSGSDTTGGGSNTGGENTDTGLKSFMANFEADFTADRYIYSDSRDNVSYESANDAMRKLQEQDYICGEINYSGVVECRKNNPLPNVSYAKVMITSSENTLAAGYNNGYLFGITYVTDTKMDIFDDIVDKNLGYKFVYEIGYCGNYDLAQLDSYRDKMMEKGYELYDDGAYYMYDDDNNIVYAFIYDANGIVFDVGYANKWRDEYQAVMLLTCNYH